MKKKLLALSLSLAMAFSLAACGGNGGTANSDTPSGGDSEGGLISVGITTPTSPATAPPTWTT